LALVAAVIPELESVNRAASDADSIRRFILSLPDDLNLFEFNAATSRGSTESDVRAA